MHPDQSPALVADHVHDLERLAHSGRTNGSRPRRRHFNLASIWRYFQRGTQADEQPLRGTQLRARRARAIVRRGDCGPASTSTARR